MKPLSDMTLAEMLAVVERPAVGELQRAPQPPNFGAELLDHQWRAVIDEMAPPYGTPAWKSVDAFLGWCCQARCPAQVAAWQAAGDVASYFLPDETKSRFVEILGRLCVERGRPEVDREVDAYAARRLAAAVARREAVVADQALRDRVFAAITAHPEEAILIRYGWMAGHIIGEIEAAMADPEEYGETRALRAEAGLSVPPFPEMAWLYREARQIVRSNDEEDLSSLAEAAIGAVVETTLLDVRQGAEIFVGPTAIDCANGRYAHRFSGGTLPPWWAEGYRRAIRVFGAETTLRELASRDGGASPKPSAPRAGSGS